MCVILVCPKNVRPDLDTLAACERDNPHGAGIAWREGNRVRWEKNDDLSVIHRLSQLHRGEIVIHFRIASVGGVCAELRHPFPVAYKSSLAPRGNANAVLFHNGTWSGWRDALKHAQTDGATPPPGPMSDTRAAAWLCSLYGHKFLKTCSPSRWVYFSSRDTVMYGQWYKRQGIYFSNLYWSRHPDDPSVPSVLSVPTHQTKLDLELELWNLDNIPSYWDIVNRNCKH